MTGKRARIYLVVVAVLVLALAFRPSGKDDVVQPISRAEGRSMDRSATRVVEAPVVELPAIKERPSAQMPSGLFVLPAPPALPPPPSVAPVVELAPPVPEVRILGWMSSGTEPYVFVEWNGESHSLLPSQTLDDVYRFDGIENGMAGFTYLPDQSTRQYAVSDATPFQ